MTLSLIIGFLIGTVSYIAIKKFRVPKQIPTGRYCFILDVDNPYKDSFDYVTVVSSKDGWVKYVLGTSSVYHSQSIERFLSIYTYDPIKENE